MRVFAMVLCLALGGCTTGQARNVLRAAHNAVGELSQIEEIHDQDISAMQTALAGVEMSLSQPGAPDFWVDAFLRTAAGVIESLEGYGVKVPSWIMVTLQSLGIFCKGVCVLFAPSGGGAVP